ncbi:MAG: fimbrial biogenesis outer membrane usher protein, partial [Sphingomonas sp.]|nr:fimbrial biogenesis outer membrane usher protein [Sphingomonas sp.]
MKPRRKSCWSGASLSAALLAGTLAAVTPQFVGATATAELQDSLLSVIVNGANAGEPVALLRGPGDKFYATASLLAAWRLTAPRPAFSRDGVDYYLLNAIPGLKLDLAESTQTLSLDARADTLGMTRLAYAEVELGEELAGGTGGFLNYDLTAQMADGQTSIGGAFEAGVFTRFGVGIASFVGRWAKGAAELVRLDTNWTIDDPARMRSIRLGDSISRGGVGGLPLRFGGVQLARNFAVQPGFVTIPLPSLRGSAALPSVVDIYVNDALSGSRDVPPGPFEITEIPIVTGDGDVQLVVGDLLGRETLYSISYYSAPSLLRKGLHDYSYEAGFLRQSFGRRSNDYGALMVSATHRYGFSDFLTGEVHAEATACVQTAGIGASAAITGLG